MVLKGFLGIPLRKLVFRGYSLEKAGSGRFSPNPLEKHGFQRSPPLRKLVLEGFLEKAGFQRLLP